MSRNLALSGRTGRPMLSLVSVLLAALVGCSGGKAAHPAASGAPTTTSTSSTVPDTASPLTGVPEEVVVTVGGLSLKGHCAGTAANGVPTVIMSMGNGQTEDGMAEIQSYLEGRTRVCAYNRAGVGGSTPPAQRPRDVQDVVNEMQGFLQAAHIPPPYFLVGGSAGGVVAFMYAQAHPENVAGFVLSNPMPPPYSKDIAGARKVLTGDELQNMELPDYRGENPESIDFTGNDTMLTTSLPASLPYAILFDENCDGDTAFCAKVLTYLPQLERSLSTVGSGGTFQWVRGAGHGIPESQPEVFRAALNRVWKLATHT